VSHSRQRAGSARAWPATALARDYPKGCLIPRHRHRRGQLIYAASGVMQVTTREGIWIVPPQRSLWVPAAVPHEIRMEGHVAIRTLYLDGAAGAPLGDHCRILAVTELLRELILAMVAAHGARDAQRMRMMLPLLLHELRGADEAAIHIPTPSDPRLRKVCGRLLADPSRADTLDQLAQQVGASSRTLARLFESELKMSFVRWRQHVRLARAVGRLNAGASIKSVARDAGYASCSAFCAMFHRVMGTTPTGYGRGTPA
jgi:AraC-like DNA-binding protein